MANWANLFIPFLWLFCIWMKNKKQYGDYLSFLLAFSIHSTLFERYAWSFLHCKRYAKRFHFFILLAPYQTICNIMNAIKELKIRQRERCTRNIISGNGSIATELLHTKYKHINVSIANRISQPIIHLDGYILKNGPLHT